VSVALDGRPIPGSSPFVIGQVVPGIPHEVVVSKQGYRAWSSQFQLQADETMQLPPVSLEPLESGFALDSVPSGAAVFVDAKRLEQTTPVRVADLGPGDHQIRLEAQGYSPWESSLHVTPGTVLELPTAQLSARAADSEGQAQPQVAVHQKPPASALPGSVQPPATRSYPRPAPSPRPVSRPSASAPEAAPQEAPAPSQPAAAEAGGGGTGTLRVQTRPWSKVLVDGRLVGTTPLMNVPVSAGHHTLTFVNDDFGIRKSVKVQVEDGQTLTQVLNLTE
jgi:serine/threonine-protein kinase